MKSKIWVIFIILFISVMSVNQANEFNHKTKRVPAEWEPQEATWMQWPGYWEKDNEIAFAKMADIISRYQKLHILFHSDQIYVDAHKALNDIGVDPQGKNIHWHAVPYDNSWMRDNGPVYVFNDNELSDFNTKFKVLPPLRTQNDVDKLIAGVKDGSIDVVTSDHNPLDIELKNVEFDNAEFGTIGLESFFGALNKIFPIKTTINILTKGKKIFGIEETPVKIGAQADMSLFNPINSYVFDDKNILSISKNSIFKGSSLKGKIYGTISNGKMTLSE